MRIRSVVGAAARASVVGAVTLVACGREDGVRVVRDRARGESVADTSASSRATTSDSPPPPPPPELPIEYFRAPSDPTAPLTPAICASLATPAGARCHWSVETRRYCSGAAPPAGARTSYPTCVCNACTVDGDCAASPGGRCVSYSGGACVSGGIAVCVYPGESCYPGAITCAQECGANETGGASCRPRPNPVP